MNTKAALGAALLAPFVAALALTPMPAKAQGADAGEGVEEITVTARRREESLQEVPLAISAISGLQLENTGAPDIVAVAQTVPNLTLEVSRGTNTTLTAFIRGVGQQDPVAGFEAGVGLYIDDVYLNRPMAAVLDVYDVERVEVLRGPQGTLYGRNTIGGAIKYVTRPLSDEQEARLRFSVGDYGQFDAVLSGSMPISDSLRVGGSIASFNRDGFGDNIVVGGIENYNKEMLAGRVRVEWDATDDISFILTGDFSQDDSDPKQGHRLTVSNITGEPVLDDVFDTRAGLNTPTQYVDSLGGALTMQWDINDQWTLKNILAHRVDDSVSPIDFDSLQSPDLDVPVIYDNEQFSEELQLLYSGEKLNGLVGFYYLDANAYNYFDVLLGLTGDVIGLPGLNANTVGDVDTESWSVFGDFTYDLNDVVSVSVGGRYTSDERTSVVLRQTYIGGFSPTLGGTGTVIATTSDFLGSEEFTEFSPRASISWAPMDDHNVYLSYSEGFKGGSFDPRSQTTAAPDLDGDGDIDDDDIFNFMIFQPETVASYEVGAKSVWGGGAVTTNIAFFLADYEDVQIPGSIGIDTNGDGLDDSFLGVTSNAGKANIDGIEFEGLWNIDDSWSLSWALGVLSADYIEFIDAFGEDVASERVFQNTPKLTHSGTLTYQTPMALFQRDGTFSVLGSWSYRDKTSQFEVPIPLLDEGAFTLYDLSLVWASDDGRWRAGIHGRNLTDEEYKVAGYNFPTLGLEGTITAFYGFPRTITGTVQVSF